MKKKFLNCLIFIIALTLTISYSMARTLGEVDFEAGQINDDTERTYETSYFVAYIVNEDGTRTEIGTVTGMEYNHNPDGSTSSTDSWNTENITEEDVLNSIMTSDELQELYKNGAYLEFEPRFTVYVDPAVSNPAYAENGTFTKDTSTGGTKDFWIKETDLTAYELANKYYWSAATLESIYQQDFSITIDKCEHDIYCVHGPNPGNNHDDLTQIRKYNEISCNKCGKYLKATCCTHNPYCQHGKDYANVHTALTKVTYIPITCEVCGETYDKMECEVKKEGVNCIHDRTCEKHGLTESEHSSENSWIFGYVSVTCDTCKNTYSKLTCSIDDSNSNCNCDKSCVGCGTTISQHPKWNVVANKSVPTYECDECWKAHKILYKKKMDDAADRKIKWSNQMDYYKDLRDGEYDNALAKEAAAQDDMDDANEQLNNIYILLNNYQFSEDALQQIESHRDEWEQRLSEAEIDYNSAWDDYNRYDYNYCEAERSYNSAVADYNYYSQKYSKELSGKCIYYRDNCWLHTCSYEDLGCSNHSYTGKGPAVAGSEKWVHAVCRNTPSTSNLDFHLLNNSLKAFSINDGFTLNAMPSHFSHYDLYIKYQDHYLVCIKQKVGRCTFIATDGSGDRCPNTKNMGQCGAVSGITKEYATDSFDEYFDFDNTINVTDSGLGITPTIPGTITTSYTETCNIDDFIEEELRNSTVPTASLKGTDVIDSRYPKVLISSIEGIPISHIPAPSRKTVTIDFPVDLIGYKDPSQKLPSVPQPNGKSDNNGLSGISVRDLRWMEYAENGIKFKVPSTDTPLIMTSDSDLNEVKMGYAVEFAFRIDNLEKDKTNIVINPSVIGYTSLKDYQQITTPEAKTIYNSKGVEGTEWTWLYYLPYDALEKAQVNAGGNPITVKFDIELTDNNGRKLFDYLDYVNSRWTGKVFMYSTEHNLLEDVYNNSAI